MNDLTETICINCNGSGQCGGEDCRTCYGEGTQFPADPEPMTDLTLKIMYSRKEVTA